MIILGGRPQSFEEQPEAEEEEISAGEEAVGEEFPF